MESPILVLWPSRGLRRYRSSLRGYLRSACNLLKEIHIWIQIDGLCNGRYRSSRVHCLWAPHVHIGHVASPPIRYDGHYYASSGSYRNQDLQLAENYAWRFPRLQDAHAMGTRLPCYIHLGRHFRDVLPVDSHGYASS